ncbi:Manganese/iron superoxide dismutase, partial [Lentinula aff. lateritia]
RGVHTAKPLPYDPKHGLGAFLPPEALRVVAIEYQQGLLDRLNDEVRGTEMANMSVMQTIISAATDRTKVLAFNYASLALNNHFFLENLKPPTPPSPSHQHLISPTLAEQIRLQHGSLAQLKSSVSAAATGLFTSGFVWLVTDAAGNIAVVPTFGPGSVLVRSQMYMAHPDPASSPDSSSSPHLYLPHPTAFASLTSDTPPSSSLPFPSSSPSPLSSSPSLASRPRTLPLGAALTLAAAGDTLYPLFCLSVHEHAWLSAGCGVWGRERWVQAFWDVLDWERVSAAY